MPNNFVESLEEARARIAAAEALAQGGEATIARRLLRELDQDIARLRGGEPERDLISIICHDLKDPLASIVMGAGFLKKAVTAEDASARRVIDAIARSAERMSQVVTDFHDLAKIEAGRLGVDRRPCDVGATLRTTLASLEPLAKDKSVRLDLELPEGPIQALCDRARLVQIVTKLVGNAVRFTPADGSVVVRASHEGEVVRLAVSDTGRGIPADRLASVFDHAANAKRTPRDGPGLGLPIVRGLVELQGGKVDIESTVSQGTTVTFTLPSA